MQFRVKNCNALTKKPKNVKVCFKNILQIVLKKKQCMHIYIYFECDYSLARKRL